MAITITPENLLTISADDIPKLAIPEDCWDGFMEYFLKGQKGSFDSRLCMMACELGLFVKKPDYLDDPQKCVVIPPTNAHKAVSA